VHKILHAEDVMLSKCSLDDGIIRERNALLVDLAIPSLINQLANRLEVRLALENIEQNKRKSNKMKRQTHM
jgi:hypothetical protein